VVGFFEIVAKNYYRHAFSLQEFGSTDFKLIARILSPQSKERKGRSANPMLNYGTGDAPTSLIKLNM